MSAPAFELPVRLEAHEPPESRGLARDEVRLLVADRAKGTVAHTRFHALPGLLAPGDLLVNNASLLGPSPQPELTRYPLGELRRVYEINAFAPLALVQLALPRFGAGARVLNVISDAAFEAYENWGGYGSSKAALAQITAVLGAENPNLRVYAVDPGDMRTQMQQEAFPGEDISDRPLPEEIVPGLLTLIEGSPSGRYQASAVTPA